MVKRCKVKTFEVGESVLWWDGEVIFQACIVTFYDYSCDIMIFSDHSHGTVLNIKRALHPDLYHKTTEDLARLKSRIHDMRYRLTNLMEEIDMMIEEAEGK